MGNNNSHQGDESEGQQRLPLETCRWRAAHTSNQQSAAVSGQCSALVMEGGQVVSEKSRPCGTQQAWGLMLCCCCMVQVQGLLPLAA